MSTLLKYTALTSLLAITVPCHSTAIPTTATPRLAHEVNQSVTLTPADIADGYLYVGDGLPNETPGSLEDGQIADPSTIQFDHIGSAYIQPTYLPVPGAYYPGNTNILYNLTLANEQATSMSAPDQTGAPQASGNGTNSINSISTGIYNSTTMNIHYQTAFELDSVPSVSYGTSNTSLTHTVYGTTKTYGYQCSLNNYTVCSAYYHDVQLTGLQSSTYYYYQINNDASGVNTSSIYTVKSPIAPGDSTPYNVTMYADMGMINAGETRNGILQLAKENVTEFILHYGDISYADAWSYSLYGLGSVNGGDSGNTYESSWDIWQYWMNNITTITPYMTAPGNHEVGCAEGDLGPVYCPFNQRNFTAYRNRFSMPGQASGAGDNSNMWYSFDYGIVHYVVLNSETDFEGAPEQAPLTPDYPNFEAGPFGGQNSNTPTQTQWLQSDLAAVNRSVTPWIIVGAHRPMYTSEPGNGGYTKPLRKAWESLFIEYGVDAYFAGHIHWYERIYPQNNGTTVVSAVTAVNNFTCSGSGNDDSATTYITIGSAGNIENHSNDPRTPFLDASLDFSHYGFGQLQVCVHRIHINIWY